MTCLKITHSFFVTESAPGRESLLYVKIKGIGRRVQADPLVIIAIYDAQVTIEVLGIISKDKYFASGRKATNKKPHLFH